MRCAEPTTTEARRHGYCNETRTAVHLREDVGKRVAITSLLERSRGAISTHQDDITSTEADLLDAFT